MAGAQQGESNEAGDNAEGNRQLLERILHLTRRTHNDIQRLNARMSRIEQLVKPVRLSPAHVAAQGRPLNQEHEDDELFQHLQGTFSNSSSPHNFAVNLVRQNFTQNEMMHNRTFLSGKRQGGAGNDHGQLDPVRMERIRQNYFKFVDLPNKRAQETEWKACCKAIDAACRALLKKTMMQAMYM